MIVGVISTQTYVQALFSARDTKTAAVGCCAAALIVIPVGLPSVMIGMFMHLHHPEINSIDALPLYLVTYLRNASEVSAWAPCCFRPWAQSQAWRWA